MHMWPTPSCTKHQCTTVKAVAGRQQGAAYPTIAMQTHSTRMTHQRFPAKAARISRCKAAATAAPAAAPVRNIEKEVMVNTTPVTLLRPEDASDPIKSRWEKIIRNTQEQVCKAIEEVDGTKFREDAFVRPTSGGGGITRVLANGNVWEKAGVNVSVVYGTMPVENYRPVTGNPELMKKFAGSGGRVPFFAAGISSVMHPWNPHCPTMHFNYRYFETADWEGVPGQWWFGGGTDYTPSYLDVEDAKHFHGTYKKVCDRHDPAYFPRFKKWCDEYFLIKHRGETRGLGGIFYDDLNDKPRDKVMDFSEDCANHIVEAYVPLVKKHMNDAYTPEQKDWQQIRRSRYVEFNLVYDRGTIFGLKTGARVESMLMSMPLTCTWKYDHEPAPGTPEAEFLDATKNPRNWV